MIIPDTWATLLGMLLYFQQKGKDGECLLLWRCTHVCVTDTRTPAMVLISTLNFAIDLQSSIVCVHPTTRYDITPAVHLTVWSNLSLVVDEAVISVGHAGGLFNKYTHRDTPRSIDLTFPR